MNTEGISNGDSHERVQERLERTTTTTATFINNGINQLASTHNVYQHSATKAYEIAARQQKQAPETPFNTGSTREQEETYNEQNTAPPHANLSDEPGFKSTTRQLNFGEHVQDDKSDNEFFRVSSKELIADFAKTLKQFMDHLIFFKDGVEILMITCNMTVKDLEKIRHRMTRLRASALNARIVLGFIDILDHHLHPFLDILARQVAVGNAEFVAIGTGIRELINDFLTKLASGDESPLKIAEPGTTDGGKPKEQPTTSLAAPNDGLANGLNETGANPSAEANKEKSRKRGGRGAEKNAVGAAKEGKGGKKKGEKAEEKAAVPVRASTRNRTAKEG